MPHCALIAKSLDRILEQGLHPVEVQFLSGKFDELCHAMVCEEVSLCSLLLLILWNELSCPLCRIVLLTQQELFQKKGLGNHAK